MPVELVFEPDVEVVAHTIIDTAGLEAWAVRHGLSEAYLNPDTPLGAIAFDVEDDRENSLDALPEFGGRFCYRSWEKGRERPDYIKNIVEMEHGSVLHHSTASFAISGVSRSLTHELVRHHAGADPSQESQRFVHAKDIRFVVPPLIASLASDEDNWRLDDFKRRCEESLGTYNFFVGRMTALMRAEDSGAELGVKLGTMRKKRVLEAARSLLPNAAETRLLWTMNLRAARHICALRGAEGADLEIRRLAVAFTRALKDRAPHTFFDFEVYRADDGFEAVRCQHPKV